MGSDHHGTVTLRGPVRSWAEREAIVGAARYTPGVRTVDDRLHVDARSSVVGRAAIG